MPLQDAPPVATAEPAAPQKTEIESDQATSSEPELTDAELENALGDPFGDDPETVE
jgi:hypothetical protein